LRLRFSHYFVNDFSASGSQNGKFGRSAKMAGGQHTADKDHAWQLGKAGDEDGFYAWMGDKWGLPHSIKLQTLFYDAKNNTQTLAGYHSATENLLTFLNQQQPPGKNMGVLAGTHARLRDLVNSANVTLPEESDITDGAILNNRILAAQSIADVQSRKNNKYLRERQQKAYRRILETATELINFVMGMQTRATAEPRSPAAVEFKTIVFHDIPKTLKGYPSGICHKQINQTLSQKLTQINILQV
jgi:hypothetical protein